MPEPLIDALLAQAGVPIEGVRTTPIEGGLTNSVHRVETSLGKFVARIYQWQHDSEELKRPIKEPYLHRLLRERDVPVPEIVAVIDQEDQAGMLMRLVPGHLLGDLTLTGQSLSMAWSTSGQALSRAHEIMFDATHGVIDGCDVRPVEQTNADWHIANVMDHADGLNREADLDLPLDSIRQVLESCRQSLNACQGRLLHNDPHPWNILVDPDNGFRCSAWLDWEYAFVGDPNWDLTRMDLWRMDPLPTEAPFWDGYGRRPDEPNRSVYKMSIYLWQAREELSGDVAGPRHTRANAVEYVRTFTSHLARLQSLVS